MARTAKEIFDEASKLPHAEIDWLIESLLLNDGDASQDAADAAWDAEIKRRLDAIDSGAIEMRPLDEVLSRLDARVAAKLQK
ncbi:MAG TPA: addiction module protein [Terracidiphilus sp.]|nr:addiction module protein [Terracidiphilus sp.]